MGMDERLKQIHSAAKALTKMVWDERLKRDEHQSELRAAQEQVKALTSRIQKLETERAACWPARVAAIYDGDDVDTERCWVVGAVDPSDQSHYFMQRDGKIYDEYDCARFTKEEALERLAAVVEQDPTGEPFVMHAVEWHLLRVVMVEDGAEQWVGEFLASALNASGTPLTISSWGD